jgi:signal transduction histidine kinase
VRQRTSFLIVAGLWLLTLALLVMAVLLVIQARLGAPSSYELPVVVTTALAFSSAGGLIALRRPDMRAGWLLIAVGLAWTTVASLGACLRYARATGSGSLTAEQHAAWVLNWLAIFNFVALFLFLLFFPDDRLPSPRWRFVVWVLAIGGVLWLAERALMPGPLAEEPAFANPYGIAAAGGVLHVAGTVGNPMFGVAGVASVVSVAFRFRHAEAVRRRQLLWMAFGGVVFGVVDNTADTLHLRGIDAFVFVLHPAAFSAVAVAAAIAILRYRLYVIDRIVSTTTIYGLLAMFVAAVFVPIVVGLGTVVGPGIADLPLSVVATAIVAISFQPARRRIKLLANRIVHGWRASPYELLAALSRRMGEPVAAEALLPEMAKTLAEGTGATQAAVWLAIGNDMQLVAAWPTERSQALRLPRADGGVPAQDDATRRIPVRHEGELLGAIAVTKPADEDLTPVEERLMCDLATQAGLALRNVRLIEELKASRQRIVTAQDAERRGLERDIHDGAQQGLITLSLALRVARARAGIRPELAATLDSAAAELTDALVELRELARGIHPAILSDQGLGPALATLSERSGIVTTVVCAPAARLPAPVEATAYQVAAHALTTATHAGASAASIGVTYAAGELVVEVTDDATHPISSAWPTSLGGLDDRVAALNGRIEIQSPAGPGNVVRAVIPCGLF